MAVKITSENFETEIIESELLVLADFYTDGCVPCKRLSPILSEIETEYDGVLKIVKINAGVSDELAEKYDIFAAPTVVFFRDGKEIDRFTGLKNKTEIIEKIVELGGSPNSIEE
ncbi:thioredoxin [Clostridia bacterium]|nr:thioredoxin [Clostridia bacterium]